MPLGTSRKFTGAFAALALCASSTGALAASTPHPAAISPLIALSVLGSGVSATALCGTSAAAAGAAAVTPGSPTSCVLPAVDQAPPPATVETMPLPAAGEPVGGAAVSPLLLALVGIAAAVGLYYLVFRGNDNFHIVFPPFPVSPS